MTKNLFLLGLTLCFNFIAFGQQPQPTVTLTVKNGDPSRICKGSFSEVVLTITPPSSDPTAIYNFNWKKVNADPSSPDFNRETFRNPGNFKSDDPTATFWREQPNETTRYIVDVFGPSGTINREVLITVDQIPNAGFDTTIFLCSKTGIINLFDELDGTPESGGTWSSGNGTYDTSDQSGGAFTYSILKTGSACPPIEATIIVKPCGNDDTDKDGIPNVTDEDSELLP